MERRYIERTTAKIAILGGMGFRMLLCPGDDILAVSLAASQTGTDVGVERAVMPTKDNFKPKRPPVSKKGEKII